MKNKYVFRSRISAGQFRRILSLFALDLNAVQIAHLSAVSRLTIGRYVNALRRRIAVLCEADFPLAGQIEVDESYFGSRHKKGNRGRGAGNKTIVFGILKRGDRVYTEIVPNCRAATLQAIIRGRVALIYPFINCIIYPVVKRRNFGDCYGFVMFWFFGVCLV